jgi:hypothetical protein
VLNVVMISVVVQNAVAPIGKVEVGLKNVSTYLQSVFFFDETSSMCRCIFTNQLPIIR